MTTSDNLAYRLLAACPHLGSGHVGHLLDEWSSDTTSQKPLWNYLADHGVLQVAPEELKAQAKERYLRVSETEMRLDHFFGYALRLPETLFGDKPLTPLASTQIPLPTVAFIQSILAQDKPSSLSHKAPSTPNETTRLEIPKDHATPTLRFQRIPQVGDTLGRCKLVDLLGRGGSSLVFRAQHLKLGIPVAVKVLISENGSMDNTILEMLRREASMLAQMNHPNILRVYDVEDEGEFPYLILELAEGGSLAPWVSKSGIPDWKQAVKAIITASSALASALKYGIIHRDIKPGNILLSQNGDIKVADLGLGMLVGKDKKLNGNSHVMVGTVSYMSPEQAQCRSDLDHRSDIYSLGATLYHLLIGETPFTGKNMAQVLFKQMRESVVSPCERRADLPPALGKVVLKMLEKDPAQRYQTYEELLADLMAVLNPPTSSSRADDSFKKSSLLAFLGLNR